MYDANPCWKVSQRDSCVGHKCSSYIDLIKCNYTKAVARLKNKTRQVSSAEGVSR